MAFTATATWSVRTDGSDTSASGGFDRGVSGMAVDGALTLATTSAPVFTSASYSFVSADVGAWLYLKSGTSLLYGWYKIVSVSGGAATLDAAAGHATLANCDVNASIGCATTGSTSGATWSVDYTRQASAQVTYTDLVIDGTSNTKATSSAHPFTVNQVGNTLVITGGSGFTTQRVAIVSVVSGVATFDKSLGTLSSTGGTGALGGALASIGQAGALHVGGNKIFQKAGTYGISSTSSNVAGGCLTLANGSSPNPTLLIGYNTVPGDYGTRPVNQATASGTTSMTLFTDSGVTFAGMFNISFDGLNRANTRGAAGGPLRLHNCKFANFTNSAVVMNSDIRGELCFCEASGCSNYPAFSIEGIGFAYGNVAHDNSVSGFDIGGGGTYLYNIAANNTGSSTFGFLTNNLGNFHALHCTAYKNGGGGFDLDGGFAGGNNLSTLVNCLAWGNGGFNYRANASQNDTLLLINCAGGGATSGNFPANAVRTVGFVALSVDPTTSGDSGDFSLNLTGGGGLLCRSAGILGLFPRGLSRGYTDIGAVGAQGTTLVSLQIVKTYNMAGQPVLTWTGHSLATAYEVLRSVNGGDYQVLAVLSPSILTYTDTTEPSGAVKYSVNAEL